MNDDPHPIIQVLILIGVCAVLYLLLVVLMSF